MTTPTDRNFGLALKRVYKESAGADVVKCRVRLLFSEGGTPATPYSR